LLLIRHPSTVEIDVFRKPTTTDTTINFTSNHPAEHKMAAYRHLIHRMLALPLTPKRRKIEWQKIQAIASHNNFPLRLTAKLKTQMQQKAQANTTKDKNKKWATFTYHSSKVRKITNLFKQTNKYSLQKHEHNTTTNRT
jgi:hypothetical protein